MRKKTVTHVANTVLWTGLYLLPVIAYLLFLFVHEPNTVSVVGFVDFVTNTGFSVVTENVVYSSLFDIFGTGGLLPLFNTDVPFIIFTWFIGMMLLHLLVDFILFIPRLAHKWLNAFTRSE